MVGPAAKTLVVGRLMVGNSARQYKTVRDKSVPWQLVYFFSAKAFLILAIIIVKIVYLGFLASYTSGVALII